MVNIRFLTGKYKIMNNKQIILDVLHGFKKPFDSDDDDVEVLAIFKDSFNDIADEAVKKLKLISVSNQRELLINFANGINIHDGDKVKIGKLVDVYLKINS